MHMYAYKRTDILFYFWYQVMIYYLFHYVHFYICHQFFSENSFIKIKTLYFKNIQFIKLSIMYYIKYVKHHLCNTYIYIYIWLNLFIF